MKRSADILLILPLIARTALPLRLCAAARCPRPKVATCTSTKWPQTRRGMAELRQSPSLANAIRVTHSCRNLVRFWVVQRLCMLHFVESGGACVHCWVPREPDRRMLAQAYRMLGVLQLLRIWPGSPGVRCEPDDASCLHTFAA